MSCVRRCPGPCGRTAGADGSFQYPWHQYRADTDCVWLAVEYHRVTEPTTTEESR
ncbi:hypothetical protein PV390_19455 [Streptomyces sp. ME02-6991-2A]|uniref:hypothetical protein n=1 Tax=Streptomyces TaxID=1883 RepID=UPI0015C63AA5|nr:hypothetical protein [Streptomyces sp. ME02-6991-2A]MDX3376575.1 hypothetical protein [Streptomyces sp. ME02-6991-2A]